MFGAWMKEGLADYVCPSDFFYTDFNAKTEHFVKLAEGTEIHLVRRLTSETRMGKAGAVFGNVERHKPADRGHGIE